MDYRTDPILETQNIQTKLRATSLCILARGADRHADIECLRCQFEMRGKHRWHCHKIVYFVKRSKETKCTKVDPHIITKV